MAILQEESRRLQEFLATLRVDDWDQPTACDQWDVSTVVVHLAGVGEAFSERIKRGLVGDVSPSAGLPEAGSVNADTWATTNADRWLQYRRKSGNDLFASFVASCQVFNSTITRLKPDEWQTLCYHPGGVISVQTLVGLRLLEIAIHGWDIGSRVSPPATLSAETLPLLVQFISDYVQWFFHAGTRLRYPARFRVHFSDSYVNAVDVIVDGDSACIEPVGTEPAKVILLCSAETFLLIMCGRFSVSSAAEAGLLEIRGDSYLASEFSGWFQGA